MLSCSYLDKLEKSLLQNNGGKEFFIGDKVSFYLSVSEVGSKFNEGMLT